MAARKKIYNKSKTDEPEATGQPAGQSEQRRGSRLRELADKRLRYLVGIPLGLVGVFLLIVFVSYFTTGTADQSLVHSYGMQGVGQIKSGAQNAGSILGANLAHLLMARGVGLAAFILALWCLVIGFRLTARRPVRIVSYTLVSLLSVVTFSIVAQAATAGNNPLFFPLGGGFGEGVNELLLQVAGFPGMVVANLILLVIWVVVCLATIRKTFSLVAKAMPRWRRHDDEDDEDQDEAAPEAESAGGEDSGPQPEPETPEEPDPFFSDPQPQSEKDEDDEAGTLEIAPEIEMAKTTKVEVYDPTKELSKYKFPTLDLLEERGKSANNVDVEEQETNKQRIIETLQNYGISIKRIDVCVGPTITLFEIVPDDGVRIAKIKNLEDDIALSLSALGIRIIAPIPGKGTVGIEVPNKDPQTVSMRSIIGSKRYQESKMELPMAMGCTIDNKVYMVDLTKMPHLLVAGATGQGKSVGLNAIITSLLYKKHPAELKFVLIDPKMVEFSLYSKLDRHYLAQVTGDDGDCIVTDTRKVIATLNSLVQEMEDRYVLLRKAGERNVKDYNRKFVSHSLSPDNGHHYLPYIVVIIDEFSDLIMTAGKEAERPIVRIAQKARAVGIHMIIATQRPSTNVITGLIKANFPGRIAFRVTQMVDSRTIIDCSGAQHLVGKGDMLFQSGGVTDRVQCAFVDTPEVQAICEFISGQVGYSGPYELPEPIIDDDNVAGGSAGGGPSERDPLFEEAAAFIVAGDTASTSSLQRRYNIGYNRAGRIMDQLERAGIVGPSQGGKPRRVLVDSVQLSAIIGGD